METRANYVLIGAFTIIVFALIAIFTTWFVRAQFNRAYAKYEIVFQGPVRGLIKGGEVRFNGIKVGEITKLELNPDNPEQVISSIQVDATTPVRTSSEARLEGMGLTGINLIQLTAGNTNDPLLRYRPGRPPPRIVATPGALDDLVAAGQDIAQRANVTLARLQEVLTDENIAHLSNTIENIDVITAKLARDGGAIDNINGAAISIRDKVDKLDPTINSINEASASVKSAAAKADTFMTSATDAADVAAYQTLPDISTAARDLRRLSVSLQRLSADIETGNVSVIPGSGGSKPIIEVAP
jgi:phospholipid/cholesterol/gamma-HCH transport system substrate-binding protein